MWSQKILYDFNFLKFVEMCFIILLLGFCKSSWCGLCIVFLRLLDLLLHTTVKCLIILLKCSVLREKIIILKLCCMVEDLSVLPYNSVNFAFAKYLENCYS